MRVLGRILIASTLLGLAACPEGITSRDDRDAGRSSRTEDAAAVGVDAGWPDAAIEPACEPPEGESSALYFDGVDDHVTMGVAPELGLTTFTVEAWVRRDGEGRAAGTGVGGISVVPIAGKGRGENDGSTLDCNYAFGFVGDVLGGDFEDMTNGQNHPVLGRTAVPRGEWHHVAATFDGEAWRLYLDGREDGVAYTGGRLPRHDSIQHFALGTAMNSMGVAAGRLHGALDEVRVWSYARTASQIALNMHHTVRSAEGLLARWGLDAEDEGAPDSAGDHDGTIVGATFTSPGAVLDRGAPPEATIVSPADGATLTGSSASVRLDISGEDARYDVRVYVRELTEEDDFAIVVLPDTQYYTTGPRTAYPMRRTAFFADQTRWTMAERARYGIVALIHNGDIVDCGDCVRTDGNSAPEQWQVATRAMALLEASSDELPDGLPYALAVGNHEYKATDDALTNFNTHFGVARFRGRAYYGGSYESATNNDSWIRFQANGLDFIVVSFAYNETMGPAVTSWGRRVLESHPGAFGIVNAHYIVRGNGEFSAQGETIYNALRSVQNLHLMTSGHVSNQARRTDTDPDTRHRIDSMLADFQGREDGGGGFLRLWEFSPANGALTVRTYSPSLDEWQTGPESEFTIPVDLRGAGGAFREVTTLRAGEEARASISGLEPGRVYEWYASVESCAHEIHTPVARFRTTP